MHRRSFGRFFGAAALGALAGPLLRRAARAAAPADAPWRSALLRDHPLAGKIWHAPSARFVTTGALVENIERASFRLLGEVHDNPDHHVIQARVLEAMGSRAVKPAVAFEQFDRERESALQQRLAQGKATTEDVADAVDFDRRGWNWALYEPLVSIALRYGMPLHAANLSRAAAAVIVKGGLSALQPERRATLDLDSTWNAARERVLRDLIVEGHCGALPQSVVPNMAAAQRARDATLAASLLASDRDGAVLIAGNGHVRRDLAVPLYLQALAPARSICAVGILEVEADKRDAQDYLDAVDPTLPPYDLVCFTPRQARPDPCAAFERPLKSSR